MRCASPILRSVCPAAHLGGANTNFADSLDTNKIDDDRLTLEVVTLGCRPALRATAAVHYVYVMQGPVEWVPVNVLTLCDRELLCERRVDRQLELLA